MAHLPYRPPRLPLHESEERAAAFFATMNARRSVRQFSAEAVPRGLIAEAIRTASTAPSGAHMQPWTFVVVGAPELKRRIREAAEAEEKRTYAERMNDAWRDALAPLGTDWQKPYLQIAPWLVVLFAQRWGVENGARVKHYYVTESCGIAAGLFVAAVHQMGLATLTHTPSPMGFLSALLGRPPNEKPLVLFPVGYPDAEATVPDLTRKSLADVSAWFE